MSRKKIGILTFHRAINYGAVLQAFALQNYLNEKYDASIIDYRCTRIEERNYLRKKSFSDLKHKAKVLMLMQFRQEHIYISNKKKSQKGFIQFMKEYFKLSEPYFPETINRVDEMYDMFISGSDQIWNPIITNGDRNYFLQFAKPYKRYSYAASFGTTDTDGFIEKVSPLINEYQSLLVREQSAKDTIEKVCLNKECNVVLDPVFLLNKEKWISELHLDEGHEKYVFVYLVASQHYLIEYAKKVAEKENLKILYVSPYAGSDVPEGVMNRNDVGPKDFLEILLGATFVLTTSFHALAFSLIFNIPFMYELDSSARNNNSRLENIERVFGFNRRITQDTSIDKYRETIDWNRINTLMEAEIIKSKALINSALEKRMS